MRGSQIPGFGNWEYVNELPITQYFECARQAGIIRYGSSGECGHTCNCNNHSVDYDNYRANPPAKQAKGRMKKSGATNVREGSKNKQDKGKVFDVTVTEVPQTHGAKRAVNAVKKQQKQSQYDAVSSRRPKAVDEDLYKIPPELLKKKKRLGFFSRCLVPPCAM
ncbi:hypothetical protein RND81_12G157000 [Saponaria officinalis]|uniref:Uncharacterized protein n=1 Tax=Saponaria officinalis TaxID=3572 RepID=A0AAW1HB32_SAPOF